MQVMFEHQHGNYFCILIPLICIAIVVAKHIYATLLLSLKERTMRLVAGICYTY